MNQNSMEAPNNPHIQSCTTEVQSSPALEDMNVDCVRVQCVLTPNNHIDTLTPPEVTAVEPAGKELTHNGTSQRNTEQESGRTLFTGKLNWRHEALEGILCRAC